METKKIVLLDIDYITDEEKAVIRLFGKLRGKNNEESIIAIDKNFKPYIYVVCHDLDEAIKQISELEVDEIERVEKKDIGKDLEVLKVFFHHPQDVPKLREKIINLSEVKEIREHDIPFYRRYLIDNSIFPMAEVEIKGEVSPTKKKFKIKSSHENLCVFEIKEKPRQLETTFPSLKILSFDIEVRNPKGMPRSDKDEIIMISLESNFNYRKLLSTTESSFEYVETLKNEKEMIQRFVEILNTVNPDLIIGYNSDNFDFPYINERAKNLKVPLKIGLDGSSLKFLRRGFTSAALIPGRIHIDLYLLMRRYLQLDRYTLERVYFELFGEKKVEIDGDKIWKYWDEGGDKLEMLFEYSMDDAIASSKIGEKMLPLSMELTRIVGQPFFDIARMTSGQMVEWFLIRQAFEIGEIIPNKPSGSEYSNRRTKSVVGGYVKEPVKGLHENIVAFDFRSLYPSIIISKNISLDTFVQDGTEDKYYSAPEVGYKFLKEPIGFVPSVIGNLLKERVKIKNKMKNCENPLDYKMLDVQQEAVKRLANSMYGLYGYPRFRWYSIECADAVTAWGRDYIKKTMNTAAKFGFETIYADTDGFYAIYKKN
jgi:DNA polymerase, archaea type